SPTETALPSSFGIKRSQTYSNKFSSLNSRSIRTSFLDLETTLNSIGSSSSISPKSNIGRRSMSFRQSVNENTLKNIINQQKPVPPNRTSSLSYRPHMMYGKKAPSEDRQSIYSTSSLRSQTPLLNSLNFEQTICQSLLSKPETDKIESCYKSIGSRVYSSKCQAGLYITNFQSLISLSDWKLEVNAVPVWVFNTGLNPKRPKGLCLCMADKKTGFSLWKSGPITYVNDFKWTRPGVITFRIVQESSKKEKNKTGPRTSLFAAIRFDDELECSRFYDFYRGLFVDAANDDLFNPRFKPQKKSFANTIYKKISKNSISSPVAFNHVNSLSVVFEESLYNLNNSSSTSTSDTQSIVSDYALMSQNINIKK
ncbi:hypothetical protein BpHYR1_022849, partial [Brachionus plicatilis]